MLLVVQKAIVRPYLFHIFSILVSNAQKHYKMLERLFIVFHETINLPCFDTISTDSIGSASAFCLILFGFDSCLCFAKHTDAIMSKIIKITTDKPIIVA